MYAYSLSLKCFFIHLLTYSGRKMLNANNLSTVAGLDSKSDITPTSTKLGTISYCFLVSSGLCMRRKSHYSIIPFFAGRISETLRELWDSTRFCPDSSLCCILLAFDSRINLNDILSCQRVLLLKKQKEKLEKQPV